MYKRQPWTEIPGVLSLYLSSLTHVSLILGREHVVAVLAAVERVEVSTGFWLANLGCRQSFHRLGDTFAA